MIKREDGSVSLYLLIILSAFLILFSVLVDAIHVRTADYHAETALRSALRSSLSDTDGKLREFGLYAMDLERASRYIFEEALFDHQEAWPEKWGIKETQFHTFPAHSLGSHDVLYRQILETMKYQAPVEFGLQVMSAFQAPDTRSRLLETSTLFRQSEQLEELMQQRDESLQRVWNRMDKLLGARGEIRLSTNQWQNKWTSIKHKIAEIGGMSLDDLLLEQVHLELDETQLAAEIDSIAQALAQEEVNESTREHLQAHMAQLNEQLDSTRQALAEVSHKIKLYEEIEHELAELRQDVQAAQSVVLEGTEHMLQNLQIAKELNDQLEEMTGQLIKRDQNESIDLHLPIEEMSSYALPASFFQTFRSDLGKGEALFAQVLNEIGQIEQGWEQEPPFSAFKIALDQFVNHYMLFYQEQKQFEASFMTQKQDAEAEKQGYLSKLQQSLSQMSELFYQCGPGDALQYERLKVIEAKYLNENEGSEPEGESMLTEDAVFEAEQTADHAIGFLEQMQKAMIVVRDRAYLNEYILSYFQYRSLLNQDSAASHRSMQRASILNGQETEYILYGLHSCEANHGAAFAELFAFRLGIRMTEALLDSKRWGASAASPMLTFLWAAAESAGKAFHDVRKLIEGDALLLSERFPVKVWLSYEDYLRLFLLLHGNKDHSLARIQALIEIGSGKDMYTSFTYAQASVEVEVQRYFAAAFKQRRSFTDSYYY